MSCQVSRKESFEIAMLKVKVKELAHLIKLLFSYGCMQFQSIHANRNEREMIETVIYHTPKFSIREINKSVEFEVTKR